MRPDLERDMLGIGKVFLLPDASAAVLLMECNQHINNSGQITKLLQGGLMDSLAVVAPLSAKNTPHCDITPAVSYVGLHGLAAGW